jgi:hypothetical protein
VPKDSLRVAVSSFSRSTVLRGFLPCSTLTLISLSLLASLQSRIIKCASKQKSSMVMENHKIGKGKKHLFITESTLHVTSTRHLW